MLTELRSRQEKIEDVLSLVLEHVRRIEQNMLPPTTPVSQHMLPQTTPVSQRMLPPTTPVSKHLARPITPEVDWDYPFMHMPLSTKPVAPQHMLPLPTPLPRPVLPPTMLLPQHILPPTTPVAHQPLAPDIPEETSPWECMYPPQAVETPAKESPAPVPYHDLRFTPRFRASIRARSCSRPNFTVNVVRSLFSMEERKMSNVGGKLGKKQLDPQRISRIKEATFQTYPLETGETMLGAWGLCTKSIDESCRRLNRKPKGKEN